MLVNVPTTINEMMQVSMNDNKEQKIRRRGWSDSSPDIYPVRPSLTNKQPQKCPNCLTKDPATNQLSTGYWKTSSASNKPWIPPENKYQNKVGMEKMNDGWHDLTTRHNKSTQKAHPERQQQATRSATRSRATFYNLTLLTSNVIS